MDALGEDKVESFLLNVLQMRQVWRSELFDRTERVCFYGSWDRVQHELMYCTVLVPDEATLIILDMTVSPTKRVK